MTDSNNNHHHFIERILAGAVIKEESAVAIRPAITPDVLPDSFQLPDTSYGSVQEFVKPSSKSLIIPGSDNVEPSANADLAEAKASQKEIDDVHTNSIKRPLNISKESGNIADGLLDQSKASTSIRIEEEPANPQSKSEDDNSSLSVAARERSREHFASKTRIIGYVKRAKDGDQMPAGDDAQNSVPAEDTPRNDSSGDGGLSPVQTWSTSRTSHRSEPVVTISIGRIEVRAAMTSAPPFPTQKSLTKTQQFTPLSLKDYLKQRSEGKI